MLEEDRKAALKSILSAESQDELSHSIGSAISEEARQNEEVWRGIRTGYARPTLSSIRSKSQTGSIPKVDGRNSLRTKHPLASSQQLGTSIASNPGLSAVSSGSNSDSDSDETLVDSFTEKEVNDYLLSRTLTPNDVRQPQDLVRPLRGTMGNVAEIVWILRPLLYGE